MACKVEGKSDTMSKSENAGYQTPTHFGAILPVARKILSKELFLVEEPPDKAKDRKNGGDKSPIRAKGERHADEVHCRARIHRISHDGVGTGGDYLLILADLDRGGAERVLFEYAVDYPHCNDN